jgi:hypothetical protein
MFDRTGSYEIVLLASFAMIVAAAILFASLPRYKAKHAALL